MTKDNNYSVEPVWDENDDLAEIDYRGRVDWEIFKKINSAVRICEKTKKEQY